MSISVVLIVVSIFSSIQAEQPASKGLVGNLLNTVLGPVGKVEAAVLCKAIPNAIVPLVDCSDPLSGTFLQGELPNCYADCVCIHGFTNGHCANSTIQKGATSCMCTNDDKADVAVLNDFRTNVCAKNQLVQTVFNTLCSVNVFNTAFHAACDTDCKCGHEAQKGVCVTNGNVATKTGGLCSCKY